MNRSRQWALVALTALLIAVGAFMSYRHWLAAPPSVEDEAREYVAVALALGRYAPSEVDSYFGPAALQPMARQAAPATLPQLSDQVGHLLRQVRRSQAENPEPRRARLLGKIQDLQRVIERLLDTRQLSFDEQARHLYGIELGGLKFVASTQLLAELDGLLPGAGTLLDRMNLWRQQTLIAADRRAAVFERALDECRRRTQQQWPLPSEESLQITWTRKTPAAWHRYLGKGRSQLQINQDAVAYFPTLLSVACHEGYPGHHVQYLLMEQAAGSAGLLVEDSVVLLRSRQSVLLEGAANLGVELAFSRSQRVDFERDVLLPLAGLSPGIAEKQAAISRIEDQLSTSILPILRDYHDRRLSRDVAVQRLQSEALVPDAGPLLDFTSSLGAYVIGYTAARDLLRSAITDRVAANGSTAWAELKHVVEHPADADLPFLIVEKPK